ncbi:E3 ubiquitin-protein ligase RHF2A-like isoform X2 [Aristolochia californica]|uniref:E3 ubiquitin-protein ligase RHF2A-like isoform X2 n=1 Tax=Aristolochia californica TaxID=171875 RepID=UPI0035E30A0A
MPVKTSAVTSCRHEYHLQCILDWSQRSKECPICWQTVVLKDPVSQELLAAVEIEKRSRQRTSNASTLRRLHLEDSDFPHVQQYSDADFDERILQHLAAAAPDGVHHIRRRSRHRTSRLDEAQLFVFSAPSNHFYMQEVQRNIDSENSPSAGDDSLLALLPGAVAEQSQVSGPSSHVNLGADVAGSSQTPFCPRLLATPPDSPQRSRTSELLSFSESLKSKLSAASSRYKESISKSTKGLKEKLMAHNNSVKELSKEVRREVTAGVTQIIERLDPAFKRTVSLSSSSSRDEGDSESSHGGEFEQEHLASNPNITGSGTASQMTSNRFIHASSSLATISEGHVGTTKDQC